MGLIGWQELLVIMVIVMLIFGTNRIRDIGKTLETAVRDLPERKSWLQQ